MTEAQRPMTADELEAEGLPRDFHELSTEDRSAAVERAAQEAVTEAPAEDALEEEEALAISTAATDEPEGEAEPEDVGAETKEADFPDYEDITAKELAAWLELKLVANTGSKRVLYDRLFAYYAGDDVPDFVPDEEPEVDPNATPEFYIVQDERSYIEVAAKFGFDNYRELGGLNGVFNSRYELEEGDKVRLSTRAQ